jgi:CheY-like chemotaxis protein
MNKFDSRPARILLVEDNPGDVRLIREALGLGRISHQLSVIGDGAAALDFLHAQGGHFAAVRPDLILLDLNLPRLDGHAVLRAIKGDEALHRIPVVVLTTSSNHRDIAASYGLGANAVVTKPIDLDAFIAAVHAIEDFWFGAASLPAQC